MPSNFDAQANFNSVFGIYPFWIRAAPQQKALQDKKDSSKAARIDENIQWIALCETKLAFKHHSRYISDVFSHRNQQLKIIALFCRATSKQRAPALGV